MISLTIGILLVLIAGMSKAIMDKVQFHYHKSIFKLDPIRYNQPFWDPLISWQNKYKVDSMTEPKFYGSTTFFVFVTDAWHLFQMIMIFTMFMGVAITSYNCETPIELILKVIILRCFFGLSFTLFFTKLLTVKQFPT